MTYFALHGRNKSTRKLTNLLASPFHKYTFYKPDKHNQAQKCSFGKHDRSKHASLICPVSCLKYEKNKYSSIMRNFFRNEIFEGLVRWYTITYTIMLHYS